MPKLWIVTPVRNNLFYTKRFLKSLENQTYKDFGIIIVDNGSTDGTAEWLLKEWKEEEIGVTKMLLVCKENKGYAGGANLGIAWAIARFSEEETKRYTSPIDGVYNIFTHYPDVLLTNNDMELNPDCIEQLVNARNELSKTDKVGVLGGRLLFPDGRIQHAGAFLCVFGWGQHKNAGIFDKELEQTLPEEQEYVTGALFYMTSEILKLQKFDEQFNPAYFEESLTGDRCIVLRNKKTKVVGILPFDGFFEKYKDRVVSFDNKDIIRFDNEYETICVKESDQVFSNNSPKFVRHNNGAFREYLSKYVYLYPKLRLSKNVQAVLDMYTTTNLSYAEIEAKTGVKNIWDCLDKVRARIDKVLLETCTGSWGDVAQLIRHKTSKATVVIEDVSGQTCVTEDHSIVEKTDIGLTCNRPKLVNKLLGVNCLPPVDILPIIVVGNKLSELSECVLESDNYFVWEEYNNGKESIHIPKQLDIVTDSSKIMALCRLLGAVVSEGGITKSQVSISQLSNKWLEALQTDFFTIFGIRPPIKHYVLDNLDRIIDDKVKNFKNSRHVYKLVISSKLISSLFEHWVGKGAYYKKIPDFIFTLPLEFRQAFLQTLIDGDGCRAKKSSAKYTKLMAKKYLDKHFSYTTMSLQLISGLAYLLTSMGEKYTIYQCKNGAYDLKLITKFRHSDSKLRVYSDNNKRVYVYDIEVSGAHNFVDSCGLVVVHNTDFCTSARKLGYKTFYVPTAKAIHYESKTSNEMFGSVDAVSQLSRAQQQKYYIKHDQPYSAYTPISDKKALIVGSIYGDWSFSIVLRNMAKGLKSAGIDVAIAPEEYHQPMNMDDWEIQEMIKKPHDYWDRVVLRSAEGDDQYLMPPGKKRIAHTTFEGTRLHQGWIEQLNHVDQVITNSMFCKNKMEEFGINTPIAVVPNSIDTINQYVPTAPPLELDQRRTFGFLVMSAYGERKNLEGALRAFINEFKPDEDVFMSLHSLSLFYILHQMKTDVKTWIRNYVCGGKEVAHAPIFITSNSMHPSMVPRMYTTHNCLVFPSKCEGQGNGLMEAGACGLPSIATNYSGMADFISDEVGFPLGYKMETMPFQVLPYYRNYIGSQWAIPNQDELQAQMRYAFEHPEETKKRGNAARIKAQQNHDIIVVGKKLSEIMFNG